MSDVGYHSDDLNVTVMGTCGYAIPNETGGEACGGSAVAIARVARHGHKRRRVLLCPDHLRLVQSRKTSNLRIVAILPAALWAADEHPETGGASNA